MIVRAVIRLAIVAFFAFFGLGPIAWLMLTGGTPLLTVENWRSRHELRIVVSATRQTELCAAVEDFAIRNGFVLKDRISAPSGRRGYGIIQLYFARRDGLKMLFRYSFHTSEVFVAFYDKQEAADEAVLFNQFLNTVVAVPD